MVPSSAKECELFLPLHLALFSSQQIPNDDNLCLLLYKEDEKQNTYNICQYIHTYTHFLVSYFNYDVQHSNEMSSATFENVPSEILRHFKTEPDFPFPLMFNISQHIYTSVSTPRRSLTSHNTCTPQWFTVSYKACETEDLLFHLEGGDTLEQVA